jgi:hypothetical protein
MQLSFYLREDLRGDEEKKKRYRRLLEGKKHNAPNITVLLGYNSTAA